ncbi:MAG: hypothetical protein GOVbin4685_43 [Prokaryotic dsDNA virus sp.]|jgi:hypothetical protein|nr:MAG: hypothetical protein GOVbin4685_43 [Prokaryotic dsDNA virus sp.]|tara:strand:+ start:4405 stop:4527 length:123 start_codon:yes stop_codon:yes gene_type:complete
MTDHMDNASELDAAFCCGVAVMAMLVVAGLGLGVMLCAAF